MQPFIEIPQVIVNNEEQQKTVTCRLRPDAVEYFYPGFYYGTCIILKSGNIILTTLAVEDLERAFCLYAKESADGCYCIIKVANQPIN